MHTDLTDAEKRRFIKRETVPERAELDAEPAGKIHNQRSAIVAADAVANDNDKSVAATSLLLNGHTTVASQLRPSENMNPSVPSSTAILVQY